MRWILGFVHYVFLLFLRTLFVILLLVVAAVVAILVTTPSPEIIKGCFVTHMNQVELCPAKLSYVSLNRIAPVAVRAVLVSEDSGFYQHIGFDWLELRRSFERNLDEGRFARGGSTLTQQLAKNAFLEKDKTLVRKIREAYLTYRLEAILSKNEILEKYFNIVELGKNLYGIGPAARHYFAKSPAELHLLEASYLAHLLPNPKVYSRTYQRGQLTKFSRKRVLQIVRLLYATKRISEDQYSAALEVVDMFPWRNLNPVAIARLKGQPIPDYKPELEEEIQLDEKTIEDIERMGQE